MTYIRADEIEDNKQTTDLTQAEYPIYRIVECDGIPAKLAHFFAGWEGVVVRRVKGVRTVYQFCYNGWEDFTENLISDWKAYFDPDEDYYPNDEDIRMAMEWAKMQPVKGAAYEVVIPDRRGTVEKAPHYRKATWLRWLYHLSRFITNLYRRTNR